MQDAANIIAEATRAASDSALSAASSASTAAQILGAVAIARLDGIDRQFNSHELLDSKRFDAITDDIRDTKTELKSEIKDIQIDLKKQTRSISLITGGLITLSKAPDIISFFIHHS